MVISNIPEFKMRQQTSLQIDFIEFLLIMEFTRKKVSFRYYTLELLVGLNSDAVPSLRVPGLLGEHETAQDQARPGQVEADEQTEAAGEVAQQGGGGHHSPLLAVKLEALSCNPHGAVVAGSKEQEDPCGQEDNTPHQPHDEGDQVHGEVGDPI